MGAPFFRGPPQFGGTGPLKDEAIPASASGKFPEVKPIRALKAPELGLEQRFELGMAQQAGSNRKAGMWLACWSVGVCDSVVLRVCLFYGFMYVCNVCNLCNVCNDVMYVCNVL